jgi:peroxiredoxin
VIAALVAAALLLAQTPSTSPKSKPVTIGSAAPAFSLRDLSGRPLALADYRGKVVVLDFWATWCIPCRQEVPHFIALQKKHGSKGLAVIGISLDDEEKPVRSFYTEFGMTYPVAMGNAAMAEQYGGILGLPVTFVIDRQGRIRFRHDGQTDAATIEREVASLL